MSEKEKKGPQLQEEPKEPTIPDAQILAGVSDPISVQIRTTLAREASKEQSPLEKQAQTLMETYGSLFDAYAKFDPDIRSKILQGLNYTTELISIHRAFVPKISPEGAERMAEIRAQLPEKFLETISRFYDFLLLFADNIADRLEKEGLEAIVASAGKEFRIRQAYYDLLISLGRNMIDADGWVKERLQESSPEYKKISEDRGSYKKGKKKVWDELQSQYGREASEELADSLLENRGMKDVYARLESGGRTEEITEMILDLINGNMLHMRNSIAGQILGTLFEIKRVEEMDHKKYSEMMANGHLMHRPEELDSAIGFTNKTLRVALIIRKIRHLF